MSITISSATATELEILYAGLNDLTILPIPDSIGLLWKGTLASLFAQVKAQMAASSVNIRHYGGNER